MAVDDPTDDGLAALANFFVGDGTLAETLTRVVELARLALGADMAGVTMLADGEVTTAVFTDDEAPEIDVAQYRHGQGPCLEAWRRRSAVRIDDTTGETDWPEFSSAAAAHRVRSTLSLPLNRADEALGALNLYSFVPGHFAGYDTERAQRWAGAAATVLANAAAYNDARELGEGLRQSLVSRATIDHAIGVIMAGGGRSPEEAFQVLVRASQRENRKLRDIAAEMVARVQQRDHDREPADEKRDATSVCSS